jgi:hypothetical protein
MITYRRTVGVWGETSPGGIWLAPCHPNPVLGVANISFGLPTRAHARLEVRDLAGRRVATLVEADLGPGRHEVRWDARDERGAKVPAGVYFYRLIVDGRSIAARRLAMTP